MASALLSPLYHPQESGAAGMAPDLAKAFDALSNKFPKNGPDLRLDRSDTILARTPTSPSGRPETTIKRLAPFAYLDEVKAAAKLLKAALFNHNSPGVPDRNPSHNQEAATNVPRGLEEYISGKGSHEGPPRLGDWAAKPPVWDQREYGKPPFRDIRGPIDPTRQRLETIHPPVIGLMPRGPTTPGPVLGEGHLSRMFMERTAAPIPDLPLNPEDAESDLKMTTEDTQALNPVQKMRINRRGPGAALSTATKLGSSFMSSFLRAGYGQ